jgi:3-hydroxyacyl-CoA dehydrogenase/enoyl-CoA hydratase/3-hydroxybutyryl-CoA epimerase
MGWGFAPYTGGPLSLIDTVGTAAFVEACDKYADELGERFRPCDLLRDMAKTNDTFYSRFNPKAQVAAAAE